MQTRPTNPVYQAALFGDYNTLVKLQKENSAEFQNMVILKDEYGVCAIEVAAARGHFDIVKLLLAAYESGPEFKYQCTTSHDYTHILTAVRGYLNSLNPTTPKEYFRSGTFIANTAKNFNENYLGIIELLLNHYPELANACDDKGLNALYYTVHNIADGHETRNENLLRQSLKLARLLLRHGVELDNKGYSKFHHSVALHSARGLAVKRNVHNILAIIENGCKTNAKPQPSTTTIVGAELATPIKRTKEKEPVQVKITLPEYWEEFPIEEEFIPVAGNMKSRRQLRINGSDAEKPDSKFAILDLEVANTTTSALRSRSSFFQPDKTRDFNKKQFVTDVMDNYKKYAELEQVSAVINAFVTRNFQAIIALSHCEQRELKSNLKLCLKLEKITEGFLFCKRERTILSVDNFLMEEIESSLNKISSGTRHKIKKS